MENNNEFLENTINDLKTQRTVKTLAKKLSSSLVTLILLQHTTKVCNLN